MSLYLCMYKPVYINMYTNTYNYLQLSEYTRVYRCLTSLRKRAALLLSKYASMNLHCLVSLAAFHSGSVAEKQRLWNVWLGKKECSGGKDYVLCDQRLQVKSFLSHKTDNFRQVSYSYTMANSFCEKILLSQLTRKL